MKSRLKYLLIVFILPVIMACNLSTLVANTPVANTSGQGAGSAQPAAPLQKLEGQVRQVVTDFLTSMQKDPSGASSLSFLSPKLQQEVSGGKSVSQLMSVQGAVPSAFQLSAVTFTPDAKQAQVDGTLMYTQPVNERFVVVESGGAWKIDGFVSLEGEGGYPSTPEQVVQTFIIAYQEAPDQMSKYLSAMRLGQLPPGGAVAMLNINGSVEGTMIQSAAVNPDPPKAAITVNLQVSGKDVTRVFSLSKENGQWKIDNIDPVK